MVDREATVEADSKSSGVQSDATPAESPATEPETEQTEASGDAGQQSPDAATPTVVAASLAAATPDALPKKRWWKRLGQIKPSTFVVLAVLGLFAALSIVGGLAFSGTAFGQACSIAFVPGLSIAIGVVANKWVSKQGLDQELAKAAQNAAYTTYHLKRSVSYVDERLGFAYDHLRIGSTHGAVLEIISAKTATELSFAVAQQSIRQWESISPAGAQAAQAVFAQDDVELRPRIRAGDNPKTVTTGEDTARGDGDK